MKYSKVESFVLKAAKPVADALGYDIYDVEYVKEGPHWFLRIYIDSENGVSLDDCETVSRGVSDKLDEGDFIKDNYFLEVSSPGIERMLRQNRHFESAIGKKISVMLKDGKKHEGILSSHTSENILLDGSGTISKHDISRANIVFQFDE